ncbi:MAG: thiol-disulfide oxidoreductase DCC family protein [Thiolinea sp.]
MTVPNNKVVCFHDGECPICNIEINAMKKLDKDEQIEFVDINNEKSKLAAAGITYKQAMARIHVIGTDQNMQTGVRGFLLVWKRLPYYRRLAVLVEKVPFLMTIMEYGYRLFAYYRLPMTGKQRLS